jgi:hypothetical protein
MLHRRQIQIIRETSFRKKPSNRRTNPPRKSLGIHDLLLPLATSEMHSAINHKNKASLRITIADYTTANTRSDLFYRLNSVSSGSSNICFVLAGAVTVNSVLASSAKTNARKRCLPAASTA